MDISRGAWGSISVFVYPKWTSQDIGPRCGWYTRRPKQQTKQKHAHTKNQKKRPNGYLKSWPAQMDISRAGRA